MSGRSCHDPGVILVVDDDEDCRVLICEAVGSAYPHARVLAAGGACEALDLLARRGRYRRAPRPDLICTDLEMPDLSGLEFLALVKANAELRAIPVLLFTGVDDEGLRRKALAAGAAAYAVKPARHDRFPAVLADAMARSLSASRRTEGHAA